ncbi:hypothetical protein [Clostridium coskatii]|uniref:Uncharacterized protein n=1 Tax=Clostridium coskatii TaxID=1705578 RepID=A0A168R7E8_9CLOT|nr:hypothetical protein [Clostridium coskatii]OAA90147.1 hypothetical protein WX73_02111 [Clostridium coskatii]OBR91075.1 hypothetical protein CLCOS_36530 [Clostridium coskatii]
MENLSKKIGNARGVLTQVMKYYGVKQIPIKKLLKNIICNQKKVYSRK